MSVPVYLFLGMLDSGKTTFIKKVIETSPDGEKPLIIQCEAGEEQFEYTKGNAVIVDIDEEEMLSKAFMEDVKREYSPTQVFIEYNGMWDDSRIQRLVQMFPIDWYMLQKVCIIDGVTFPVYIKNMPKQIMEKILAANMILFNRCTEERIHELRDMKLRVANRRAEIFMERVDGVVENYKIDGEPMYDLNENTIHIHEEDYPLWYVEMMDSIKWYLGKEIIFSGRVHRTKSYLNNTTTMVGRWVMTCCENDMTYMGISCAGGEIEKCEEEEYIEVKGILENQGYNENKEWVPFLRLQEIKKIGQS